MGDEEMPRVINFMASVLERVAETNDRFSHVQKISMFDGLTRPTISVQSYLERIFKYANCSPSCFIVAYIYLDRFSQRHPLLPITSFNVHRLLITSVLLSAKFMDDIFYNNGYYAKVGGISRKEMNLLEVDLLFGIGFQLNVTPTTFHTYCSYLQTEMLQLEIPMPLKIDNQKYCSIDIDDESV
ncbi:Cyclin-U4-1 [Datura stramonium]|uniref:Cyclin n=1 Tax=Datura stramonium TaxID=4076 RepID=A0ABS8RSR5_DATST|nr:Cyclin-U4-1 [Datura stramonium]